VLVCRRIFVPAFRRFDHASASKKADLPRRRGGLARHGLDGLYRAAVSEDAALAGIRVCSGKQFDPDVVDTFISVMLRRPAATRA
jgi:hypothetical protein